MSKVITELIATLKEFENLDKQNVLSMGSDRDLHELFETAIQATEGSINLMKTTVRNLGRPLTAEEKYIIQETLAVLHRLLCFYIRGHASGTQFETITDSRGYLIQSAKSRRQDHRSSKPYSRQHATRPMSRPFEPGGTSNLARLAGE